MKELIKKVCNWITCNYVPVVIASTIFVLCITIGMKYFTPCIIKVSILSFYAIGSFIIFKLWNFGRSNEECTDHVTIHIIVPTLIGLFLTTRFEIWIVDVMHMMKVYIILVLISLYITILKISFNIRNMHNQK